MACRTCTRRRSAASTSSSAPVVVRRVWSSITRAESRVIPVKQSSRLSSSSSAISSLMRSGLTITLSVNSITLAGLRAQKELAVAMKAALLTGELNEFGALLGEAWIQKKRMSAFISNERIDELYELALSKGALGGKITGAGGGGYILLFCDFTKKHRLIEALEFAGATVTEFAFDSKGLTTWLA